jgi:hypothetical protein
VIDFTYEDSEPWPSKADGDGYSLSSKEKNPVGDPADYHYWTLSSIKDGTPFADNSLSDPQVTDSLSQGTLIAFPNPTAGSLSLGFAGEEEGNQIELWLFNSLGQPVVHTFSGNFEIIDLAAFGLPAGMYILKGKTEKYSGKVPLIILKKK